MKYLLTLLTIVCFSTLSAQENETLKELEFNSVLASTGFEQANAKLFYVISLNDETIEIPYSENLLIDLKPDMVESINVVKRSPNSSFDPYRLKKVNGVIMLRLKDSPAIKALFEEVRKVAEIKIIPADEEGVDKEVKVMINGNEDADVLYQIEIDNNKLNLDTNLIFINEIRPDDIKNISVLKDSDSLALFGAKGKDGIIIISLKKNETTEKLRVQLEELAQKEKDKN